MQKMQNPSDIDFVILWVDPTDEQWQRKKAKYAPGERADGGVNRYRDWGNLQYWFRAVEKYAPWVRKIHFVTDGQIPGWLNLDHPKLCHVNHSDYILESALPLFNSSAIEVGIHRIPGLSEKFVYFNDDVFITDFIEPEYYFTNGVPNDMAGLTKACVAKEGNVFAHILLNNYRVLNKYFDKKNVIKKNKNKWLRLDYGKTFVRTLLNINRDSFDGLVIPHLSVPYLKTDFEKVWSKESDLLRDTQHHKFREVNDLSHLLFRYWRMCEGSFIPKRSKGKYISLDGFQAVDKAIEAITKQKYPEICINDVWNNDDFDKAKEKMNFAFDQVLFKKCSFEN